jgi:CDP-glycerol glycerophosphotransferase (TagB/SpsB family)
VASPSDDLNDLLALADVLVTDYSSSVFDFALLRRPIVLVAPDLEAYERDPGLYLDLRTDVVGTLVRDTDAAAAAITAARVDDAAYDAFIARHLGGCDGRAAERIVERFLPGAQSGRAPR